MQQSRLRCEPVRNIGRRTVLTGALALAGGSLGFLIRADATPRGGQSTLRMSELLDRNDRATSHAIELAGRLVTLRGYLSPALRKDIVLDLYERSPAVCFACGLMHDPGRSLAVIGDGAPASASPATLVEISGTLEIGGDGRVFLRA